MSEQTITERPAPFSITWHWTFCAEECGWESAASVDPATAKAEGDAHALEAHGIPLPPPRGGWKASCEVERCGWTAWSLTAEEKVTTALAEHMAAHEEAWEKGIGAHRGHHLIAYDGGMGECSCFRWVPLS